MEKRIIDKIEEIEGYLDELENINPATRNKFIAS